MEISLEELTFIRNTLAQIGHELSSLNSYVSTLERIAFKNAFHEKEVEA